jgi:Rad3-related DNA helicase
LYTHYEANIKAGRGSIFFAVCRGKASEGIDFSDKKARAVMICGIPFPALKDPKIVLKKRIMNEDSRSNKGGEDWYRLQAYRAVNQAIGRVYF